MCIFIIRHQACSFTHDNQFFFVVDWNIDNSDDNNHYEEDTDISNY